MANTNKHNLSKGHRGEPSSPGLHSTGPPQSGRKIYKNTKKKKIFKLKGGDSKADVSTNMRLLKKHFWIHCVYLINSYLRQKQNKIPCSGFSLRLWKETINKKHYYYMFLKNTVRSNTCWSMKRFTTPKKYAHTLGVMSTFQNESMFICEKVVFFFYFFFRFMIQCEGIPKYFLRKTWNRNTTTPSEFLCDEGPTSTVISALVLVWPHNYVTFFWQVRCYKYSTATMSLHRFAPTLQSNAAKKKKKKRAKRPRSVQSFSQKWEKEFDWSGQEKPFKSRHRDGHEVQVSTSTC